jgi:hypothetical protein
MAIFEARMGRLAAGGIFLAAGLGLLIHVLLDTASPRPSVATPAATAELFHSSSPLPADALVAWRAKLDSLTLANAESLAHELSAIGTQHGGKIELSGEIWTLLSRWVAIDPETAMRFVLRSQSEPHLFSGFFEMAGPSLQQWAKQDLPAARQFVLQAALEPRVAAKLAPALMEIQAKADPAGTRLFLESAFVNDSTELRPALTREAVRVLAQNSQQRQQVRDWLLKRDVAQSAYGLAGVEEMARVLAHDDYEQAFAFSRALPNGSHAANVAWEIAARQWSSQDPEKSTAWVLEWVDRFSKQAPLPQGEPEQEVTLPPGFITSQQIRHGIKGYVEGLPPESLPSVLQQTKTIANDTVRSQLESLIRKAEATRETAIH